LWFSAGGGHGDVLAQETNLHSKFHSCRMWNEISSTLTLLRDAHRAHINLRKFASPLLRIDCVFRAQYHFALFRAKCPFKRPLVNTIDFRGVEIGYEITESDSSGLTSRRWPCFRMFFSLWRAETAFFLFYSQLFAAGVVADGNYRKMSIHRVRRFVLVTTKWPLKGIKARSYMLEPTYCGLFRIFGGSIILCVLK